MTSRRPAIPISWCSIALLLALCCRTASGCSCGGYGTLELDYQYLPLVFMAYVTAIEPNGDVLLQVNKVWKSDGQPIAPIASRQLGFCGVQFRAETTYVIFARRLPAPEGKVGKLLVEPCSHTIDLVFPESCSASPLGCRQYNQEVVTVLDFLYGQKPQDDSR